MRVMLVAILTLLRSFPAIAGTECLPATTAGASTSAYFTPLTYRFESTSRSLAIAPNTKATSFANAMSDPHVAPVTLNGVSYLYMVYRVRENHNADVMWLSRVRAENMGKAFDSNALTDGSVWERIPSFRIASASNFTVDASIIALRERLIITWSDKDTSGTRQSNLMVYDPKTEKVQWSGRIQQVRGWTGQTGALLSMARVTAGEICATDAGRREYFDSYQGTAVLGHPSYLADSTGLGWGFFLQQLSFDGSTVSLGKPIKVDANAIRGNVWYRQNMILSNGGGNCLIVNWSFNLNDDPDRPARTTEVDYPAHEVLFCYNHLPTRLAQASTATGRYLDLSSKAPTESDLLGNKYDLDEGWTQGGQWSWAVTHDLTGTKPKPYVLYEAWGAERPQPSSSRDSVYPGAFSSFVWSSDAMSSKLTCDQFCGLGKRRCLSAQVLDRTTVKAVALHSGKCLNIHGASKTSNAPVIQWPCGSTPDFIFDVWDGVSPEIYLTPRHSGKCVTIQNASNANGAYAIQWDCAGWANQRFKAEPVKVVNGVQYHRLRGVASDRCLSVAGRSTANGAGVQLWQCYDDDSQLFTLPRVNNTHGMEMDHRNQSVGMLAPSGVLGAVFTCSDIGTQSDTSKDWVPSEEDLLISIPSVTGAVGQKVSSFGETTCLAKGAKGFAYAEWVATTRDAIGALVPPDTTIASGDKSLHLVCSRKHASNGFLFTSTASTTESCETACLRNGPGPTGSGYRSYKTEMSVAATPGQITPYLDRVGMSPDFSIDYYQTLMPWMGNDTLGRSLSGTKLNCVCGPGQVLDATLGVRAGK